MTLRERIIYGAVVAAVVFLLGEFVLGAGTLVVNVVFGLAMGIFAMIMVTLAAKFTRRGK